MSRFVLDATITMAWCFTDEATAFTETLLSRLADLSDRALVPALWLYEVVNDRFSSQRHLAEIQKGIELLAESKRRRAACSKR